MRERAAASDKNVFCVRRSLEPLRRLDKKIAIGVERVVRMSVHSKCETKVE